MGHMGHGSRYQWVTWVMVTLSDPFPALYPTSIWCHRWGWSRSNFAEIFGVKKLETLVYYMALFVWSRFSHLCRTPTCDIQTDEQTDGQRDRCTMTAYTALALRRAAKVVHNSYRSITFLNHAYLWAMMGILTKFHCGENVIAIVAGFGPYDNKTIMEPLRD